MRYKLQLASLALFVCAALSWLAETLFYGDVDAQGVLQESFFLPLTFILLIASALVFLASRFAGPRH